MVLFFCLVYCVMLLSSLLCCSVYSTLYCPVYSTLCIAWSIECFYVMSRRPYWCPKTMEQRPCWCAKPVVWELSSFVLQTLSFVPITLHRCWPREWKHTIVLLMSSLSFCSIPLSTVLLSIPWSFVGCVVCFFFHRLSSLLISFGVRTIHNLPAT